MKVIAREFSRQAGNEVLLRHHSLILQNLGKSNLTSFSNLLVNPNIKGVMRFSLARYSIKNLLLPPISLFQNHFVCE